MLLSLSLNNSRVNGDIDRFNMNIKLVKSNGKYVGCKMIASKTRGEIFSFQFDNGVEINEGGHYINADCQQLIGFVIENGKQVAASKGLSTCGTLYPCPSCLWNLADRKLPSRVKEYGTKRRSDDSDGLDKPNVHQFTYKLYTKQTGNNNLDACYKNFQKLCGSQRGPISIDMKKSGFSVISEPLLKIDNDLFWITPVYCMHISQGIMTHLTLECSAQLENIGKFDDGFTTKLVEQVLEHIDAMKSISKDNDKFL